MPLYFAYGSNVDRAAMTTRCPTSKPLGVARLARHRFIVTREGYASVLRDPQRTVWGLLWDIAFSDMPALDRYESVASGLYVKLTQPVITERGARRALIYCGPQPGNRAAASGIPRGSAGGGPRCRLAGGLYRRDRGLVGAGHRRSSFSGEHRETRESRAKWGAIIVTRSPGPVKHHRRHEVLGSALRA